MRDKEKVCPKCGGEMKYRGSRRFICRKCGTTIECTRPCVKSWFKT